MCVMSLHVCICRYTHVCVPTGSHVDVCTAVCHGSKVDPEENEESKQGGLMKGCRTSERVTVNRLARAGSKAYKSQELSDI